MNDLSDNRDPFEVVAESFLARFRAGERPSIEEYAALHPELAEQICELLPALVMVEQDLSIEPDSDSRPSPVVPSLGKPWRLGDYRILREIGRGGMGLVYEAEQISLNRRVALKVLPSHVAGDRLALQRFHREAQAAARLHHTNIVPVFEVGQEGDLTFYAMQLIEGQGLDQVIDELRRVSSSSRKPQSPVPSGLTTAVAVTLAGPRNPALVLVAESLLEGRLVTEAPDAAALSAAFALARTESLDPDRPSHEPSAITLRDEPAESGPRDSSGAAMLPGGTQVSAVDTSGRRMPFFRSVAQIGRQAAQGLAYAHARGIVHRDIKPSNLLLDTAGVVWITDFGLAKTEDDGLTATGDILGTLRYMAPCRFRGEGDARADIYALGLTLYELLTLRPAFDSTNRLELIEQIKSEEPIRPRTLDSYIPRDLETIVLKAIEKEPERRYQTADEMSEDLRRFLADEPIRARQISTSERYWRWARRNPSIAILGGILTGVLVVATIASLFAAARFAILAEREGNLLTAERWARREADQANTGLRSTQDELRQTVYATRSNLAIAAWDSNDLGRLRDQLDRMPPHQGEPDLRGWEWDYLNRLAHEERLTFRGHEREVSHVSFSPDGKTAASVEWGGRILLWDPANGKIRRQILATKANANGPNSAGTTGLAFSPDGERLAGPGPDATVGVWNVRTGALITKFMASSGGAPTLVFSPDGRKIVSGTSSRKLRLWDASDGRLLRVIENVHESAVTRVVFSPDGQRLASAGLGSVKLWDIEAGRLLSTFPCPDVEVFGLAFSPDQETLASGGSDQMLRIWDIATGQERARFWGNSSAITTLAFRPDGSLASGGADAKVRLWDIKTGHQVRTFKGHTDRLCSLAFSPDGTTLASSSFDKTVMLWDTSRPSQPLSLATQSSMNYGMAPGCVVFSPDDRTIASGHHDSTVRLWDSSTGSLLWTLTGHRQPVNSVAFSPDGKTVASASDDKTVRFWDSETGQPRSNLFQLPDKVYRARFSPDGRRLLTLSADTLKIWDVRTNECILTIPGEGGDVFCANYSPDGKQVAAGVTHVGIKLWDAETGQPIETLGNTSYGRMRDIVFTPDGRGLAVCFIEEKEIEIWDIQAVRRVRVLKGHSDLTRSLAFSPDGHRLVSSAQDRTIRLWDTDSGRELLSLREHSGWIRMVVFSSDGRKIASASDDGKLLIWDASPRPDSSAAPAPTSTNP